MQYIQRLLEHVIDAAARGNTDLCIHLESKSTPDRWVQLTFDSINATYPFADEPLAKARALELPQYRSLEVMDWKPNVYATFEHGTDELEQVAAFVAEYMQKILGVNPAEPDVRVEEQQL